MYAPVVTRFLTYDVKLEPDIAEYCMQVLAHPFVTEWIDAAKAEHETSTNSTWSSDARVRPALSIALHAQASK